ncbi:MBL fold metallo-hydrolase [Pedobacter psychrodurus]|uniref:MBL fold metallo-hydrolase n=1 Tax=Pedobacter psychrodurus TaxID=2530456 RepID=UPI002930DF4A|nr:MBL fold metallo-hydrolase [Pedobacter psychrodurus]
MKKDIIRFRRLGWAGVELQYNDQTLLIDYIRDTSPLMPLRGPDEPFPPSSQPRSAVGALLTHLHADHADPGAVAAAIQDGSPVYRPAKAEGVPADLELTLHAEKQFEKYKLATEIVGEWEERSVGPFRLFSAPAVDGFGDRQISWIVEFGDRRIIHAGDTMFHGYWWRIANKYGPFDIAFLPINGPIVEFPFLQPSSSLAAVMTPEQAAVAANLLSAKAVVPIHYQALHKPPMYTETPNPTMRLTEKLISLNIQAIVIEPGVWVDLI